MKSYADRLGEPHLFDVALDAFTHVFSIESKYPDHINALEGHAFLVMLRWILRSRKRHSKRVVVLLDSAVWLGAASKGRSCRGLNRLCRKAAALELAGDIQVHLILVPSHENASDPPSRGARFGKESSHPRRKTPTLNSTRICVSPASSDIEQ
jgi:hypothetical protein